MDSDLWPEARIRAGSAGSHRSIESSSKPGSKMVVIPEPRKELRGRVSAAICGWVLSLTNLLLYLGVCSLRGKLSENSVRYKRKWAKVGLSGLALALFGKAVLGFELFPDAKNRASSGPYTLQGRFKVGTLNDGKAAGKAEGGTPTPKMRKTWTHGHSPVKRSCEAEDHPGACAKGVSKQAFVVDLFWLLLGRATSDQALGDVDLFH